MIHSSPQILTANSGHLWGDYLNSSFGRRPAPHQIFRPTGRIAQLPQSCQYFVPFSRFLIFRYSGQSYWSTSWLFFMSLWDAKLRYVPHRSTYSCTTVLEFFTFELQHMIRYKYLPFTYGKPRPRGRPTLQSIWESHNLMLLAVHTSFCLSAHHSCCIRPHFRDYCFLLTMFCTFLSSDVQFIKMSSCCFVYCSYAFKLLLHFRRTLQP